MVPPSTLTALPELQELSATAERQEYLKGKIKEIFDDSEETYGYRRVHAELARQGEQATSELVRRLMRDLGLVPCQVRKPRSLTTQATDIGKIPDLVKRDFTAAAPYRKLISDITEIRTWQGKVYLATVIDCFSKEVIGWAMASHFRTPLITGAMQMAAKNHLLAENCIAHSDRGSNYTSRDYAEKVTGRAVPYPTRSRCRRTPPARNQNHHQNRAHQQPRNQPDDAHPERRLTPGLTRISARGAVVCDTGPRAPGPCGFQRRPRR